MYILTKKFKFSAAHKLDGYDGDYANLHGHTWELEVAVEVEELDEIGMGIDFIEIKRPVGITILEKLDHKYLNEVVPFNPTAEDLAEWIYYVLSKLFSSYLNVRVQSIKVWESADSSAEYRKDV